MDEGALVLGVPEEPPDIGEQNQLLRPQGFRQLGSGGVRVDVIGRVGIHPLSHGGDDGDIAVLQGVFHRLGVHAGDPAHQAVFLVHLLRLEELPVHAAQAHGPASQAIELGHQVLVDLAAEDGLDDVHGGDVGIAQAVYKFGLVADHFQHGGNLRPAAVDGHHPDAHQVQ